jgi:SAM-dependent methyltransferase
VLPNQLSLVQLKEIAMQEVGSTIISEVVECPICGGQFPEFRPAGRQQHPNSKCPQCGSKKRHRLQWLFLKQQTNFFTAPLRVLHFAPESFFSKAFAALPNLDYCSADIEPGRAMLTFDMTAIPDEIGTFDVILCSHVLEHVPDDQQAMRELYRVLRPGGWALIMVPIDPDRETTFEDPTVTDPTIREQLFNQRDHVRIYGQDVQARLEVAGFTVTPYRYAKILGPAATQRYSLKRKDDIFFCTKPLPN